MPDHMVPRSSGIKILNKRPPAIEVRGDCKTPARDCSQPARNQLLTDEKAERNVENIYCHNTVSNHETYKIAVVHQEIKVLFKP